MLAGFGRAQIRTVLSVQNTKSVSSYLSGQNTKSVSSYGGQSSYLDWALPQDLHFGRVKVHGPDPHAHMQRNTAIGTYHGFLWDWWQPKNTRRRAQSVLVTQRTGIPHSLWPGSQRAFIVYCGSFGNGEATRGTERQLVWLTEDALWLFCRGKI